MGPIAGVAGVAGVAGLLLLVAGGASAQVAPAPPAHFTPVDSAIRAEMRRTGAPGASIAVVVGNRVAWSAGYGSESAEEAVPVTAATLFRIGSVTKTITGLAAAALAAEGKVALDAPIGGAVPSLHPELGRLTLHQLLSHQAGLINEASADGPHDDAALGARVRAWGPSHLFAGPGEIYSYSSPGYWLAGHVLEVAADTAYADVLATRVFAPLGMTRSTPRPLLALTWPLALDHRVGPDGAARVARPYPDDASTWPGGSVYSSAAELARLAVALMDSGRVDGRQAIPAAAVRLLHEPQARVPVGGCAYSYGLSVCDRDGRRTLSHYGFRSGSGAVFTLVPDAGVAVVVLSNRNGGIFGATEQVALRAALAAANVPPAVAVRKEGGEGPATPRPVSAAEAARFVGSYANGPDTLHVERAPDGLGYRYRDQRSPVRLGAADEILVLGPNGDPVQAFTLVRGASGGSFLHDGMNAFRRIR